MIPTQVILALSSFDPVFKGGKRWVTRHFTLLLLCNQTTIVRLGQSVAKKVCKGAVGRNYMRRYCREWVRLNESVFSGFDVVLIHRKHFRHDDLSEIRLELQKLIEFARQCQKLS